MLNAGEILVARLLIPSDCCVPVRTTKREFSTWSFPTPLTEDGSLDRLLESLQEEAGRSEGLDPIAQETKEKIKTLTEVEISYILGGCLQALAHIRKHRYAHRDVKPPNILVTGVREEGGHRLFDVALADFGLAKKLKNKPRGGKHEHKCYVGTPYYRADEVEGGDYSFSADVFSLGVLHCEKRD